MKLLRRLVRALEQINGKLGVIEMQLENIVILLQRRES